MTVPSSRRYPTAAELLARARQATGLTDFGPGDFEVGLEVLLDSLERDADLHPSTDDAVIGALHRRLVNRLQVEAWYAEHPEITDLPVRGPIDVCGLPRTGTTALGNMLSLDDRFRCLRLWEQVTPVPPPVLATEATDPRRLAAMEDNDALPAEIHAMHIFEVDAASEDSDVLGMAFHGQQFTLPVWGYHQWWRQADLTDTYHYHRRVIRLLGSRRPPDLWLFKAPHHKFHLEAVVAAYPDVRFVMTHRDPAKVVPSYASIVSTYMPAPRTERDLHRVGREVAEHLRLGMENAIAARERLGPERFIDVHHRQLAADPLATVASVYEQLGMEFTPDHAAAISAWHELNRTGAHGTHRYTPEQFGVSASQLHA
ncbi:MAG: sulfotransferase [Acidimicrobiales bacterium]|nr:sulfotransferase [Acidimicrobiales bacterium]